MFRVRPLGAKPPRRKPRPRTKQVAAGPYRSQSSVPSIRRKATPREHRRVAPPTRPSTRRATAALRPRLKPPTPRHSAAAAAAQARALNTLKRGLRAAPPDPRTAIQKARYGGVFLNPKQERQLSDKRPKPVPVLQPGPYRAQSSVPSVRRKARTKEVISLKPQLSAREKYNRAKYENIAGHENLKQPEDLTNLITLGIPLGIGVSQIARGVAKYGLKAFTAQLEEQAAGKTEATIAKAAAAARSPATGLRAARNIARRATRRTRIPVPERAAPMFTAKAPGTAALKAAAGQSLPVVRGHERANPVKTLETTSHAAPGLIAAPVALAASPFTAAGRVVSEGLHAAHVPGFKGYSASEIAQPVTKQVQAQVEFAKQTARVLTADDPKEVQKAVEGELGYILPIMAGLGGYAAGKELSRGRITETVRSTVDRARAKVGREHGMHGGKAPKVFERAGQHREVAVTFAKGKNRRQIETQARMDAALKAAQGARRKEVVREGVRRSKRLHRKRDLEIADGDVASFLQPHPEISLDNPMLALEEVKRIGRSLKELPEGVHLREDRIHTRDVIRHIESHPGVLANPHVIEAVRQYRAQGRHARTVPGLSPEHSDRARFLTAAIRRRNPLPEHMFPKEIRGEMRAKATYGVPAKEVMRREAKSDRSRARKLQRKAATRESRARALRRELAVRQRAEPHRAEMNATIEARAQRMDAQARTYREGAKKAAEMAKRKRKASQGFDKGLNEEFVKREEARLRSEGVKEMPEYQQRGQGHAHEAPAFGSNTGQLPRWPGKAKFRKGTAEEYGMVEEGIGPMLRSISDSVSRRESYKAVRELIQKRQFGKTWDSEAADALFRGPDPVLNKQNWMKVDAGFFKRVYDVLEKGGEEIGPADEQLIADLEGLLKGKTTLAKPTHRYKVLPTGTMKEIVRQLSSAGVWAPAAQVNRATNFLMLATSPAWAAAQVFAEGAQAVVAQPKLLNPAYVHRLIRAYKEMSPHERWAYDAFVGVTKREIARPEEIGLGVTSQEAAAGPEAFTWFNGTAEGRTIKAIPQSIRSFDQWKGGRIRVLVTAAKLDSELNGFLRGLPKLYGEMGKQARALRGKSLSEQMAFMAEHPKWAERYGTYLDDVMGNWSALTHKERIASQVVIFYPFLRMAMRWLHRYPARHPLKAAALVYLGQANASAVKKMLGGAEPSYFYQWGQAPLYTGKGGKAEALPLERISLTPALIEALGERNAEGPLGARLLQSAQPVIGAGLAGLFGLNPLTGKQEAHSAVNAANQFLSLSPITRVANEALLPSGRKRAAGAPNLFGSTERQEALDKLFAKLNEYGTPKRYARSLGVPFLPRDSSYETDLVRLRNILKTLAKSGTDAKKELAVEAAKKGIGRSAIERERLREAGLRRAAVMKGTYRRANAALDRMLAKYKVPFKKEEKEFLDLYGEVYYESKPRHRGDVQFFDTRAGRPDPTSKRGSVRVFQPSAFK